MREACKYCGNLIIEPSGPVKAEILLVGSAPDWEDIKNGEPLSGKAGDVLREELQRAAVIPGRCRVTNLWVHAKNPKDCEVDFHVTRLFKELTGRKYILLMGTDAVQIFMPEISVSDVTGLEILSPDLPKDARALAMYAPSIALSDKLGETRFAIENFSNLIHGKD